MRSFCRSGADSVVSILQGGTNGSFNLLWLQSGLYLCPCLALCLWQQAYSQPAWPAQDQMGKHHCLHLVQPFRQVILHRRLLQPFVSCAFSLYRPCRPWCRRLLRHDLIDCIESVQVYPAIIYCYLNLLLRTYYTTYEEFMLRRYTTVFEENHTKQMKTTGNPDVICQHCRCSWIQTTYYSWTRVAYHSLGEDYYILGYEEPIIHSEKTILGYE